MNDSIIDVHYEIYLLKQFMNLKNVFFKTILEIFDENIFMGKKDLDKMINDIFIRWWMVQYCLNKQDNYVIPNILNFEYLNETLTDFIKKNDKYGSSDIIKFIDDLKFETLIENIHMKINKFQKSNLILKLKNNYQIIINKKLNNVVIELKLPYSCHDFDLFVKIPISVYLKIKNKCDNDVVILILMLRYKLINSWNTHLSINPYLFKFIKKTFNVDFECFGSCFNTVCENYCSLFYDLEKHFGSKGSFFDYQLNNGFYELNPPFITTIIELSIEKILHNLEKSNTQLSFFMTLPVWDFNGKKEIIDKELGKTTSLNNIDYEDFNIINKIKSSKYLKLIQIIPKNNFAYFDYYNTKMKSFSIQHTYIIILSNQIIDFSKCIQLNNHFSLKKKQNKKIDLLNN